MEGDVLLVRIESLGKKCCEKEEWRIGWKRRLEKRIVGGPIGKYFGREQFKR